MTPEDLLPLLNAVHYGNLLALISVFILAGLTLIELIRLLIVIKRSVKGRMDRV